MSTQDSSIGSPLGKKVVYETEYNPALLYPIPRAEKRAELGIAGALPFVGADIWNAYEISWLNLRGKPVVALGVFTVPADSPNIVESKSLKLYLNSFNQSRLADIAEVEARIAGDLGRAVGAAVDVRLEDVATATRLSGVPAGVCIDDLDIEIDQYEPVPGLLSTRPDSVVANETLYSHLLKSNCLVTGQPDWGMLAVRYSGPAIDREALLRYIVSFREHNEFHEQCVERIFMGIQEQCRPEQLAVWARYTRRGGLDINPVRASSQEWADIGNPFEARQ
ncbi:NADPH-dependent 7-cyano-7-deazaguanine reductase QueF [Uliginosibacterium sp. H3]|uniref:NADPH-dependent 7-cyano-7-deazaguanine reductase n=1 Tax=Uliginosibacterium silvisoli TaxID=3114758 RepID=A0ABU6K7X4_9RHOO|nr:NADPH-dependent 7-cyano-7-deazaguanine reductase QueF [Uliginosibacterium sp. H3]MEC5387365.1 NADPH-dependent 7-cyano-7-deazaguanine reductase QueF [Uliginosibacterium sp. H3]